MALIGLEVSRLNVPGPTYWNWLHLDLCPGSSPQGGGNHLSLWVSVHVGVEPEPRGRDSVSSKQRNQSHKVVLSGCRFDCLFVSWKPDLAQQPAPGHPIGPDCAFSLLSDIHKWQSGAQAVDSLRPKFQSWCSLLLGHRVSYPTSL